MKEGPAPAADESASVLQRARSTASPGAPPTNPSKIS